MVTNISDEARNVGNYSTYLPVDTQHPEDSVPNVIVFTFASVGSDMCLTTVRPYLMSYAVEEVIVENT